MVRQHVNPLSRFFQLERSLPPPGELFANPAQPIQLDIGCARGRFLLALAQQQAGSNHLGVEIRRPLVDAAEADRQRLALSNLHYLSKKISQIRDQIKPLEIFILCDTDKVIHDKNALNKRHFEQCFHQFTTLLGLFRITKISTVVW